MSDSTLSGLSVADRPAHQDYASAGPMSARTRIDPTVDRTDQVPARDTAPPNGRSPVFSSGLAAELADGMPPSRARSPLEHDRVQEATPWPELRSNRWPELADGLWSGGDGNDIGDIVPGTVPVDRRHLDKLDSEQREGLWIASPF